MTAAGADITYALSAQGSAAGHFGRVNSGLTSPDLETHQTGTGFEGTGLKLDTLSNQAWAAGNATDRFELCISGSRLASHGSQTITLELNTTDSFADGPWSPTPGETAKAMIIRSFASPGSDPTGLAFDGKYLYNCDGVNALIYKLDLRGRVIGSFATPALGPEGLTFDGKYLWTCHDVAGDPIYQLDLKGRIIRSFTAPGIAPVPAGLASDGKYLLYCDGAGLIYKLDFEGTIITSFSPPGSATRGLAFDGKYLWACDRGTDKIYQMDLEGRVVQSFDSPSTIPNGLAFHGGVLWHCDPAADRIYMLDVKPLI